MTAFLVALGVALVVTPLVALAATRWQLIDVPNHRSLHDSPIPRGGGVGILVATCAGVLVAATFSGEIVALLIGAVILGLVGLLDDRFELPAMPRLALQLIVPLVTLVPVIDGSLPLPFLAPVVVLAVAGFVNAFNFMDGINGISGWHAAVGGLALGAICADLGANALASGGWAVAGASLGFLPFNIVRPSVFLGDVGSYFLGVWLAGLGVLAMDAGASLLVVVAPFLLYLADTATVLVRRARRGDSLMEAHREHAYQRITQLGYSHVVVAAGCGAISAGCAALMWPVRDSSITAQTLAFVPCVLLVGLYLAAPMILERIASKRLVAR